jgi:hypothetical protein
MAARDGCLAAKLPRGRMELSDTCWSPNEADCVSERLIPIPSLGPPKPNNRSGPTHAAVLPRYYGQLLFEVRNRSLVETLLQCMRCPLGEPFETPNLIPNSLNVLAA